MKVAFTRVSRVNELICIENDRDDGSRRAIRKQLSAEREETSPGFSTGLIGSLLPSPLPNRYYHFYNKIDAFSSYDETRSVSINHIFSDHSPMLHRIKKFSFILLSSSLLACLQADARNYTAGLKQRSGKTTEILGHFDKRRPSFSFRPTFFRRFWSREFEGNIRGERILLSRCCKNRRISRRNNKRFERNRRKDVSSFDDSNSGVENSKEIFVENESLEGKKFERKRKEDVSSFDDSSSEAENSKEIFVENESLEGKRKKKKGGCQFFRRFWRIRR